MSNRISFGVVNGKQLSMIHLIGNTYEFEARVPGTVGRDGLIYAEAPFDIAYAVKSWRRTIATATVNTDRGDLIAAHCGLLIYRMAKRRGIDLWARNLPRGKSRGISVEFFGISEQEIVAKRAELGR